MSFLGGGHITYVFHKLLGMDSPSTTPANYLEVNMAALPLPHIHVKVDKRVNENNCYIGLYRCRIEKLACHERSLETMKGTYRQNIKWFRGLRRGNITGETGASENRSSGILPLLHACRERDRLPRWPSRGQQLSHQR